MLEKTSTLATRALSVVLQHLMIPNFGWSIKVLEERLSDIRKEIVSSRLGRLDAEGMSMAKQSEVKNDILYKLSTIPNFFDDLEFNILRQRAQELDIETLLPDDVSFELC